LQRLAVLIDLGLFFVVLLAILVLLSIRPHELSLAIDIVVVKLLLLLSRSILVELLETWSVTLGLLARLEHVAIEVNLDAWVWPLKAV